MGLDNESGDKVKNKIKNLIIKDIMLFAVILFVFIGYSINSYDIHCFVRKTLLQDDNPSASLKKNEDYSFGFVDDSISQFNPIYVYYEYLGKGDYYVMRIRYICNDGNVYSTETSSDEYGASTTEEILDVMYLRSYCEFRSKLDTPEKEVGDIKKLKENYISSMQIEDRNTFESAMITNADDLEENSAYDLMKIELISYVYASNQEYIPTKLYTYSNGVAQKIVDGKGNEVLEYLDMTIT